jgi:hypothetical protein
MARGGASRCFDRQFGRHQQALRVDRQTYQRASAIVINDWESVIENDQSELLDPIKEGLVRRDQVYELGDLFLGNVSVAQPPRGRGSTRIILALRSSLPLRAASYIARHWPKVRPRPYRQSGWAATCPPITGPGSGHRRDGGDAMRSGPVLTMLVAAVLLGSTALPAVSDDVVDFYRNRRINFIIGFGTGGGYDIYARLFARFVGEHIPASPQSCRKTCRAQAAAAPQTGFTRPLQATAPHWRLLARLRRPIRPSASPASSSTHASSTGSAIWWWSTISCLCLMHQALRPEPFGRPPLPPADRRPTPFRRMQARSLWRPSRIDYACDSDSATSCNNGFRPPQHRRRPHNGRPCLLGPGVVRARRSSHPTMVALRYC